MKLLAALLLAVSLTGCVLTKVVTTPLRITGAVISVIPVVGDAADSVIETVADTIDIIPL